MHCIMELFEVCKSALVELDDEYFKNQQKNCELQSLPASKIIVCTDSVLSPHCYITLLYTNSNTVYYLHFVYITVKIVKKKMIK